MNPFRKLTPLCLAVEELEEAQCCLLSASSAAEYARAIVVYNQARIMRLRGAIKELNAERPATSVPLADAGGYDP
jgi:hypothetical protein